MRDCHLTATARDEFMVVGVVLSHQWLVVVAEHVFIDHEPKLVWEI